MTRHAIRIRAGRQLIAWIAGFTLSAVPVAAQTGGSLLGRVTTREGEPIANATLTLVGTTRVASSDSTGRFVLAGVPAGERALRVERIGFKPAIVEGIIVSLGRPTLVQIQLEPQPVEVGAVEVQAQRVRLIEPDVSVTREIVLGREMRVLPIDRVADVVELTPGVSGGHFRGGRAGQEVYVIDGLEIKNRLEASAHGLGIELPPTALEEVEVITGGASAAHGSALSGVVSFATRRGNTERWTGHGGLSSDEWAPAPVFHGVTHLSVSAGGPLHPLGQRATLYLDGWLQSMADADPRQRGLTCLRPEDADADVGGLIRSLQSSAPALYCPYSGRGLPSQRGGKRIAFARLDAPLGARANVTVSALHNRLQHELYSTEFRYNPDHTLGQRSTGSLLSTAFDWSASGEGSARHFAIRLAWVRLDRYLGAIDAAAFDDALARAGLRGVRFLGESFARRPIETQLADGGEVPGYIAPGGTLGSPFGAAGAGLFHTTGTPHVANWTQSDTWSADVLAERLSARGGLLRVGASFRGLRIESYERVHAHLAGSSPSYARFYPANLAAFVDARLAGDEDLSLSAGVRVEAFRAGVRFRRDPADFLAPVLEPDWQLAVMPRLGVALPIPGSNRRSAIRFNYGLVAQPPDYRFFLDTTIGDSVRTMVERQGNPSLSFERGRTYEIGVSQILGEHAGIAVTAFRKELRELASGGLQLGSSGNAQYSTNDFGTVKGLELSLRAQWNAVSTRAGWSLQKAVGVASGTDADTLITGEARSVERPLAFDQRHAIDVSILLGSAAGQPQSPWSVALTAQARSGYPLDRLAAAGDTVLPGRGSYLPWTSLLDLRVSRTLGSPPGCARCSWRVLADARNLLGTENILALRRDSGRLAPTLASLQSLAQTVSMPSSPIPRESPLYSRAIDIDGDGLITISEFQTARMAAALDRFDPSLFIGEARTVRLGIEVTF